MRCFRLWFVFLALAASAPLHAQDRLNIVASFSIPGDFVRNVGGDRVSVITLVGPEGDVHVYAPSPADARKIADAKLLVINGLGLEGWLPRLLQASGSKAPIIAATNGIAPLTSGVDADPHGLRSPHPEDAAATAQGVADRLVAAGVEGVVNFAPVTLNLPDTVSHVGVDLAIELEQLSFSVVNRANSD